MPVLSDPEGAAFGAWLPNRHRGSKIVNEHGSINFNDLHCRNVEGARAFYGAVFGWGALHLGDFLWTPPGYADHLEQANPGFRKGMAEIGAPEGFEEVVASLGAIADDEPDTSAHWGVTFAVDDADRIAARAAELGGKIVTPPVDAPWVRMTVIEDPQGATFTASQFVPENQ